MSEHDLDGIKKRERKSSPGGFRTLFIVLVIWAAIFMGYYLFSGWSSRSEADAVKKARDSRHDVGVYVAAGKKLYGSLCAACHGESAKGGVGPDLTVSTYKYGRSRADITKSIAEGRPAGMPSFSSQIDKEQVEALVEFVLTLK